jgi:hypothetical protein
VRPASRAVGMGPPTRPALTASSSTPTSRRGLAACPASSALGENVNALRASPAP